jgi:uncharacterized protein YjiS (DUF1127 family)
LCGAAQSAAFARHLTRQQGFDFKHGQGEGVMEMHSRQSLYEIHGISAPRRRQKRRRPLARLAIARILAVLKRIKAAIEAELGARHATTELASMNDHMLRDLGITRSDIADAVRGTRANVGTDGGPFLSNERGQSYPALPTVNSPGLTSEGRLEQASQRMRSC